MIHEFALGGPYLPLPPPSFPLPSLSFSSFPLSSCPLPSAPILSPSVPSLPLPLEVGPLFCGYGVWGSAPSSPSGSGRSQAAKRFLVNCRLKITPVVYCSSNGYRRYMIDRKKLQYVTLYVSHNIPAIVQWDYGTDKFECCG